MGQWLMLCDMSSQLQFIETVSLQRSEILNKGKEKPASSNTKVFDRDETVDIEVEERRKLGG